MSRGRIFVLASLCIAIGAAVAMPAAAQATPAGSLRGNVIDSTGLAMPNVAVEAQSETGRVRTTTDAAGHYALALPDGTYRVSFRLPGFAASIRRSVQVSGGARELDVTMQLALSADVLVTARRTFRNLADVDPTEADLVGIAASANEGVASAAQIEQRAAYRVGEVLETVPGVVISQHSGEGKANQYYVRGFNIDHGTDLATTVAGVPVNMPTHGHGQGYSDLNFLIPELVSGVQFRKGPYFAEEGDFSAAGASHISYFNVLDRPMVKLEGGEDAYGRILALGSPRLGSGHLLYAGEVLHHDGPWVNPDGFRKLNGVLRYSRGGHQDGFSVTVAGYDGRWASTDQVARRAVDDGLISRFGTLDESDGGRTRRLALSGEWRRSGARGRTEVEAYALGYRLNLYSNFTYFLDDAENGDQFEQEDRRKVAGLAACHRWLGRWGGREVENVAGLQLRHDDIDTVGLYHTRERGRLNTVRQDAVTQSSASAFAQDAIQWTPWLRTVAGLRTDYYRFQVRADNPANAGEADASLISPKLTVVLGPWRRTELYLNAGYGFHSNDGRGSTLTVDPKTGEPSSRVDPLVRAEGAEVGMRTTAFRNVHSTITVWGLDIASELLFVGDAGTTEASRPTRRVGVEWSSYVNLKPWLTLDADLAYSRARFRDDDPASDRVPGAIEGVASVGLTVEDVKRISGSLRLRYFGPRPLIEDDSVRSQASATLNARLRYAITKRFSLAVDAFNLLDAEVSGIDYFYASRLPGEPAEGVLDLHTHPLEPRAVRASLTVMF